MSKAILKAEPKCRNIGYRELAEKLTAMGSPETDRNIANKIQPWGIHSSIFPAMPIGDWRSNVAARGWLTLKHPLLWVWVLIVGLILIAGAVPDRRVPTFGKGPSETKDGSYSSHSGEQQPNRQNFFAGDPRYNPEVALAVYAPNCAEPKDHDEADLCEQRQMAKAAWVQVGISLFGAVLVACSLFFSAWTIKIAGRQTESAAKQTEIANKTMQMTHGAFIEIKDYAIKIIGAERRFNISFKIHNSGKSNAIIESLQIRHHVGFELPDEPDYGSAKKTMRAVEVMPGDGIAIEGTDQNKLSKEAFIAVQKKTTKYFIYGRVTYKNVFGTAFERGFAQEVLVEMIGTTQWRTALMLPQQGFKTARYEYFREKGQGG